MVVKLYIDDISPPVRSVLLTVKALQLPYETVYVNLRRRAHFQQWFLEINPQHTVPVLDDNGFIICDSHAIITYLARRYGKTDLLYPEDFQERAIVDQRLHFDNGVMYTALRNIIRALILLKQKEPSQYEINETNAAYSYLEHFLEKTEWIAGNHITLADYSLIPTVTSADVLVRLDSKKYPKIQQWLEKVKQLPDYSINEKGLENFQDWIESCKLRCDT